MENKSKLNSNKEVITFLAKQFPLCFTTEGEARPLKIGIFHDLVKRINNEANISKTQLRSALRLYTSSWRYLYGIKLGSQRVDLDGNPYGKLETQHVEHARKQLEEAKARVQLQRVTQQAKKRENNASFMPHCDMGSQRTAKSNNITEHKHHPILYSKKDRLTFIAKQQASTAKTKTVPITDISTLKIGQEIKVKVGKVNKDLIEATVMEIAKEGIRVQLSSGMALIIRTEHLQFGIMEAN